jgi:hypothetical protein
MLERQAVEQAGAAGSRLDQDPAAVAGIPAPPDEAGILAAVHQAHGALVSDLETLGQVRDRGSAVGRAPGEEQELILGRRNPAGTCDRFGSR